MTLVRKSDGEAPLQSVVRNLEAVLNTRPGHGSVVEVFGLGDPEAWDQKGSLLRKLEKELQQQVQRFEPRVVGPAVRAVSRDASLWAHLELTGSVQGSPARFLLLYHTILRTVRVELTAPAAEG